MHAIQQKGLIVIPAYCILDILAGAISSLIHLGQEKNIRSCQMRHRLSQRTAWQHIAIAKHIHRIHQDNVQITLQLPMLEAIIQNSHLSIIIINCILA